MDEAQVSFNALDLCNVCAAIDFDSFLRREEFPSNGLQVATWPESPEELATKKCVLCQLFASVCNRYAKRRRQQLLAFDQIFQSQSVGSTRRSPILLAMIRRRGGNEEFKDVSKIHTEIGQRGFVIAQSPNKRFVNRVCPEGIDYDVLASWLRLCKHEHNNCHSKVNLAASMDYLKLIDCENMRIVTLTSSTAVSEAVYLTLSYVWGSRKHCRADSHLSSRYNQATNGTVLHSAPKTIKDAIIVVRGLGYQYLWVDQYCIDQEDTPERTFMLENMHLIYGNAEATIVATYGLDDNAGLPGVSNVKRLQHICVKYGNAEMISSLPNVRSVIRESYWNKRGWTYQEAKLSKRCFFFSKYQVYFVCGSECYSEAVNSASSTVFEAMNDFRLEARLFEENLSKDDDVVLDRLAYSQRLLSKSNDGLNAFRGILSQSKWLSIWGNTIKVFGSDLDCYDGFAMGLLWKRYAGTAQKGVIESIQTPIKPDRRLKFPTWSWTSVIGPVYSDMCKKNTILNSYVIGTNHRPPTNLSPLRVWIRDENHNWQTLQAAIEQQNSKIIKEVSPCILIEGEVVQVWSLVDAQTKWYFEGLEQSVEKLKWRLDFVSEEENSPLTPHQALVVVHWHDNESLDMRRFVLMVLERVEDEALEDETFERKGLLSSYDFEWKDTDISEITKVRKQFILT